MELKSITFPGLDGKYSIQLTAEDVGARPDTWLPTIAEIGAAPAGYGLGSEKVKELTSADDINNIRANGWYAWTDSVPQNAPINYSIMRVWGGIRGGGTGNYYAVQELFTGNTNYRNIIMRRTGTTTWGEWEFENPPMLLGVEYRTTERWNGKVVCCKVIDFGALPNSTYKSVNHNTTITRCVRYNLTNKYSNTMLTGDRNISNVAVSSTVVQITTSSDQSAQQAWCTLWYTKD